MKNTEVEPKLFCVAIDGKELPVKIGQRVMIGNDDKVIRTCVGLQIRSSGEALIQLAILDSADIKYSWISLAEINFLNATYKKKTCNGFAEAV